MNLQIALILIGIVIVLGIYLYSRWQPPGASRQNAISREPLMASPRKSRKRMHTEPSFGGPADDLAAYGHHADIDYVADAAEQVEQELDHDPGYDPGQDVGQDSDMDPLQERDSGGQTYGSQSAESVLSSAVKPVGAAQDQDRIEDGAENDRDDDPGKADISDSDAAALDEAIDDRITDVGNGSSATPVDVLEIHDRSGAVTEDAGVRLEDRAEAVDQQTGSPGEAESQVMESPSGDQAETQREDEDIPLLDSRVDGESGASEQPQQPGEAHQDEVMERDNDSEQEYDLLDDKPSLKAFIGSMNPIQKLRGTLQEKLDAVKAEREGTGPPKRPAERETDQKERESEKHPGSKKRWWGSARRDRPDADQTTKRSASFRFDDGLDGEGLDGGGLEPDLSGTSTGRRDGPVFSEHAFEESTGSELEQQIDVSGTPAPGPGQDQPPDAEPDEEPVVEPDRLEIQPADGFEKLSQIDYYVKLSGDRDVSRESVLAIYREGAGGLSKAHSIYGMRLPDKVWCDLEHESEETRFGDLVITIQLVDQDGPVTEHDMTRFSSLVMKLSESTGRGFAFMAPIENAHQQALAIEQFRDRFDSIFLINIRPLEEEMFEGPVIDRCATQIGLVADANGFYARYKPIGKQKVCLYSLANLSDSGEFDLDNMRAERTRGVTFFTRPAVNRSPGAVFAEMVDAAKAFASRIKGEAIAPGYEDLSSEDIETIRRSIEAVAAEMESYGINPGSEEANRLF